MSTTDTESQSELGKALDNIRGKGGPGKAPGDISYSIHAAGDGGDGYTAAPTITGAASLSEVLGKAESNIADQTKTAIKTLTDAADVPTFTVQDNYARSVMSMLHEHESTLAVLVNDIEAATRRRDALIEMANQHFMDEVAVLRGRETDVIRTIGAAKATIDALKR